MGIKKFVKKVVGKSADAVAKLSALSPEQLEQVQEKREAYLVSKPDMTGLEIEEMTSRYMAESAIEIYHAYLSQLKDLYIPIAKEVEYDSEAFHSSYNIRYINITKWVIDKRENSLEKLVNVYEVLSNDECNISLVFHRKMAQTNVYLAVTNTNNDNDNVDVESYRKRLTAAVRGNFPGATWNEKNGRGQLPCFEKEKQYSVASVSNIPTEKSEKFISQTIEKLLDGVVPETVEQEYILVLLATPIKDVAERKLILSNIYSQLAPYSSWQTNYTYTEADTVGSSGTIGVNVGASAGTQRGTNAAETNTSGETDTEGNTQTETETRTKGETKTTGTSESTTDGVGVNAGVNAGGLSAGGSYNHSRTKGTSISQSISKSFSEGKSFAKSASRAMSKSRGLTSGVSNAMNFGLNFGANFARTSSVTVTIGKNEGIVQSFTNHNIKHALELLDEQMKRFEQSSALGMWDFAAYVLSEDQNIANNVAHSYLALTQGESSHMSQTVVNLWRGDISEESGRANEIADYLRDLRHPIFALNPHILERDETFSVYPGVVTATTALSGKELAYSLNFPQKSIAGLPVLECAEFGRNIISYEGIEQDSTIPIGKIFHMSQAESTIAQLTLNSLASHTFITGSTGTGKSSTIYKLLSEVRKKGIKFLVVEPAKGEYKHVFGNDDDVTVYGTNPAFSELLRINPFAFPKGVHVLEHLDRLVEIFNVCWPMYAAMPVVLKNAIEKAYQDCGWDLLTSTPAYENLYPTFRDVARHIKIIIDSSEYDAENKGAYKGSLLTRLESLTNGINGLIFSGQTISDVQLFDENVIVDLSRLGSTETKSLIMGMLVLKLQEYRMTQVEVLNSPLKHLTVLEEAHHILKRTSSDQSLEGANLVGKSVEMIANSIAEMRTYGEGFIIADQAPGLLDMAVIRNTNTKMIMRLPDFSDRDLVGKSANLNDDQIIELARLPKGVAALYQNEWLEPILVKVDYEEKSEEEYQFTPQPQDLDGDSVKIDLINYLSASYLERNQFKKGDLERLLHLSCLDAHSKRYVLEWSQTLSDEPSMHAYADIISQLYPEFVTLVQKESNIGRNPKEVTDKLWQTVHQELNNIHSEQAKRDVVQATMTYYYLYELKDDFAFQEWVTKGGF